MLDFDSNLSRALRRGVRTAPLVRRPWSGGQFYGGVVIKHDHLGHHVRYDDGDDRVYADILAKTWRFA